MTQTNPYGTVEENIRIQHRALGTNLGCIDEPHFAHMILEARLRNSTKQIHLKRGMERRGAEVM